MINLSKTFFDHYKIALSDQTALRLLGSIFLGGVQTEGSSSNQLHLRLNKYAPGTEPKLLRSWSFQFKGFPVYGNISTHAPARISKCAFIERVYKIKIIKQLCRFYGKISSKFQTAKS